MHHAIINSDETIDVISNTYAGPPVYGGMTSRRYSEDGSVMLSHRRLGKVYKINSRGRNISACFSVVNNDTLGSCVTGGDIFAVTRRGAIGSYYGRYGDGKAIVVGDLRSHGLSVVNKDGTRVYYSRDETTLSYVDNGHNIDTSIEICYPIVTSGNVVYGDRGNAYLWSWDVRCNFIDCHEVPTIDMGSVLPFDDSLIIHEHVNHTENHERIRVYDTRNRALYDADYIDEGHQHYMTYFYI